MNNNTTGAAGEFSAGGLKRAFSGLKIVTSDLLNDDAYLLVSPVALKKMQATFETSHGGQVRNPSLPLDAADGLFDFPQLEPAGFQFRAYFDAGPSLRVPNAIVTNAGEFRAGEFRAGEFRDSTWKEKLPGFMRRIRSGLQGDPVDHLLRRRDLRQRQRQDEELARIPLVRLRDD